MGIYLFLTGNQNTMGEKTDQQAVRKPASSTVAQWLSLPGFCPSLQELFKGDILLCLLCLSLHGE